MANPFHPNGYRSSGSDLAKGNQIYHFNAGPDIRVKQHKRAVPVRSTISRGLATTPLSQEIHHRNMALMRNANAGLHNSPVLIPRNSTVSPMDGVAVGDSSISPNSIRSGAPLATFVSPIAHATVNLAASLGSAFVGWWSRHSASSSGGGPRVINNKGVEERPLSYFADQPFGQWGVPDTSDSTSTMDGGGVPPNGYFRQANVSPGTSARNRVRARRLLPASAGGDSTMPTNTRTPTRVEMSASAQSNPSSSSILTAIPENCDAEFNENGLSATVITPRNNRRVPGNTTESSFSDRRLVSNSTAPLAPARRATLQINDFDGNNSDREQNLSSFVNTANRIDEDDDTFVTPPTSPTMPTEDISDDTDVVADRENTLNLTDNGRSGNVSRTRVKKRSCDDDDDNLDVERENSGADTMQSTRSVGGLALQSNTSIHVRMEQPLQFLSPVPSLSEHLRRGGPSTPPTSDFKFGTGGSRTALDEFNLTKLPSFYVRRAEAHRKKIKRDPATGSSGGSAGNDITRSPSSMSSASSIFSAGRHQPTSYQPSTAATFRTDILKSIHNNFRSPLLQDIIMTGVQQRSGNTGVSFGANNSSGITNDRKPVFGSSRYGVDDSMFRKQPPQDRQAYGISNDRSVVDANVTAVSATGADSSGTVASSTSAAPLNVAIQFLYITERQNDAPLDVPELLQHASASATGTVGVHNKFTGQTMQVNEAILRAFVSYRAVFSNIKQANPHFFAARCQETDAQADSMVPSDSAKAQQQQEIADVSPSIPPNTEDADGEDGSNVMMPVPQPSRPSVHQRLGTRRPPPPKNADDRDSADGIMDSNVVPSSVQQTISKTALPKLSQQTFNSTPEAFSFGTQQKQPLPVTAEPTKEQYKDMFSFGKQQVPRNTTPTAESLTGAGFNGITAASPKISVISSTPPIVGGESNNSVASGSLATDVTPVTSTAPMAAAKSGGFSFGPPVSNSIQPQPFKQPEINTTLAPATSNAISASNSGSSSGFNFAMPSTASTTFPTAAALPTTSAATSNAAPLVFGGGVGMFSSSTQSSTSAVTSDSSPATFSAAPFASSSVTTSTAQNPVATVSNTFLWGTPPATSSTAATVPTPAVNGGFPVFNFGSGNSAASTVTTTATTAPFGFGSFTAAPTTAATTSAFGINKSAFTFGQQTQPTTATSATNSLMAPLPNGTTTAAGGVSVFRYANPGTANSAPNLAAGISSAPATGSTPAPFGGGLTFGSPPNGAGGIRPSLFNFGGPTAGTAPAFGAGGASTAPFTFGQPQQLGGNSMQAPAPQQQPVLGGGMFGGGRVAAVGPAGGTATVASIGGGGGLYSDATRRKLQARRTHSRHR